MHVNVDQVGLCDEFNHGWNLSAQERSHEAVNCAHVEAVVRDIDAPCSIGQVKGKLTHFVGGGPPFQSVLVGGHDLRGLPTWEACIPT